MYNKCGLLRTKEISEKKMGVSAGEKGADLKLTVTKRDHTDGGE